MGKAGDKRRGLKLFLEKRTREVQNLEDDWHRLSMKAVKERIKEIGKQEWNIYIIKKFINYFYISKLIIDR